MNVALDSKEAIERFVGQRVTVVSPCGGREVGTIVRDDYVGFRLRKRSQAYSLYPSLGYRVVGVRSEPKRITKCSGCGSEDLFSGYFDADDLAVTDDTAPGTRWTTFCNRCGSEQ